MINDLPPFLCHSLEATFAWHKLTHFYVFLQVQVVELHLNVHAIQFKLCVSLGRSSKFQGNTPESSNDYLQGLLSHAPQ